MASRRTLFIFLCAYPSLVYGLSGFYADNSRDQSVLYRPLAKRDKQELEQEILGLLGLDHRPKPRNYSSKNSAPKNFLLELYKEPRLTTGADVIVSFVNRIHHKAPHLRHERNRRFWFDIGSEVPPEEEIIAAEFRVYRDPSEHKTENPNSVYVLELYAVSEKNALEIVDEMLMSSHERGWLIFNVTGPVTLWSAFPENNNGLYLKIKSPGSPSKSFDPEEIGIVGPKGMEDKQPFLVTYFKTASDLHVRKTRATKKRQHDSYYDPSWNPYINSQDTYPSRRSCQRLTLYVSFRSLGWEDWIIAPDGYASFYCHGECSFPLNAHMNATNHAIVQTLVHLMNPLVVPKPCCAPTQLSAITVLYFDDNSNVILKKYRNMVVKSCGCH